MFSIDSGVPLKDKALRSFNNFLEHCPELTTLELKFHHQSLKFVTSRTLSRLRRLESLKVDCGRLLVGANVSQGKIQDMFITVVGKLAELEPEDLKFIKQEHVTRLVITYLPEKTDEDQIVNILRHNRKLRHLQIGCLKAHCLAIVDPLELQFHHQGLIKLITSETFSKLRDLETMVIDCRILLASAKASLHGAQDMAITIERLSYLHTDDIMALQERLTQLSIKYTPQNADEGRLVDLLRHCSRLTHLTIGCRVESCLRIADLIISTRSAIHQEKGSACLRTFELVQERFALIDDCDNWDYRTRIQCFVTFATKAVSFDMRTWVQLQFTTQVSDDDPVCDFMRKYGWSVVSLNGPWTTLQLFWTMLQAQVTLESKDWASLLTH
jgi:hypothetical protein